ncbi:MAG: hypothetical protein ACT4OF_04190 [Caulobacteraceae bacterium]
MADSLLRSFVTGTRAMLFAQLIVSVGAVALAGWTLGVTNQLIRERDRLQERVIQLEETMAVRGDIPPAATAVVEPVAAQDADAVYPGSIADAAPIDAAPITNGASPAPASQDQTQRADRARETAREPQRDLGSIVTSLFGPAPPLRTVVLHVRAREDAAYASRIARALQQQAAARVLIDVMPPGDPRQSGYAYFDGRQSRAASDLVAAFHEAAREMQIAQWSAQLRGVALPAQGEYTADRLDIVLPPLPAPPAAPAPADPELRVRTP